MINIAARDLFLNALAFCLLVLIIMIPHLNPPAAQATATPPGNMTVSIAWPEGATDVDLWVTGPGQKTATGYSNRGGSLFNLLRDDLGLAGDTLPLNYENAYSRGLPDGEYVVNLHCFTCATDVPVAVEVTLGRDGKQALAFKEIVQLRHKQELTAVRFRLKAGAVVPGSISKIWQPLREAKK